MNTRHLLPIILASLALALVATSRAEDAPAATGSVTGTVNATAAKYKAGTVVYLADVPGSFRPGKPLTIDQKGMAFVPHVAAIVKGTTVRFVNSDSVRHNVFSPDGEKYDLGAWGQGESKTHTFAKAGTYRQLCNVHPEMSGVVVVLDNPYFAVTGNDGKFDIANVPPGTYDLKVWNEKLEAAPQKVTVPAGGAATAKVELKHAS